MEDSTNIKTEWTQKFVLSDTFVNFINLIPEAVLLSNTDGNVSVGEIDLGLDGVQAGEVEFTFDLFQKGCPGGWFVLGKNLFLTRLVSPVFELVK